MKFQHTRRGYTQKVINKWVGQASPDIKLLGHALTYKEVSPSSLEGESARRAGEGFSRGFTLIELMVVILIIGILAAVALPQYQQAVIKSRYTLLKTLVASIVEAEEIYYLAHGTYTRDFAQLDIFLTGGTFSPAHPAIYVYNWGSCEITNAGDGAWCRNEEIKLRYQRYFSHAGTRANTKMCIVQDIDLTTLPVQTAICKQDRGLTSASSNNQEWKETYWWYQ